MRQAPAPRALLAVAILGVALAAGGCSGGAPDTCSPEGVSERGGPRCCAGACGVSTDGWTTRTCVRGKWICDHAVPEDACASPTNACQALDFCGKVGIGKEEPDPAPELCCEGTCAGTKALHRVCSSGTQWECPGYSTPISRCPDYRNACGGVLATYRGNSFKLP